MNETIDCTNCCIADFKHSLCDCHGDFCTKYKSIGDENDFMQAVLMNRPSGEVDAVREYEHQVHNLNQGYITLGEFNKRIEPLRHLYYDRPSGEWIRDGHHIRCKECGTYFCDTDREGDPYPQNFCPHCGARMFAKDTNVPNKKGADDE